MERFLFTLTSFPFSKISCFAFAKASSWASLCCFRISSSLAFAFASAIALARAFSLTCFASIFALSIPSNTSVGSSSGVSQQAITCSSSSSLIEASPVAIQLFALRCFLFSLSFQRKSSTNRSSFPVSGERRVPLPIIWQ